MLSAQYEIEECENTELKLKFVNSEACISNAIRRTLVSDVPSVGFIPNYQTNNIKNKHLTDSFYYNVMKNNKCKDVISGDIEIFENTTKYHNELLIDRLCMIPICIEPEELLENTDKFVFELTVQNEKKQNKEMRITSEFITFHESSSIMKENRSKKYIEEELERIFPCSFYEVPDAIVKRRNELENKKYSESFVKEYIYLFPLYDNESIKMILRPTITSGYFHASFSPVSTCFYTNVLDEKKLAIAKENELKDESNAQINNHYKHRYFKTNSRGLANEQEFILNTFKHKHVKTLMTKAFDILLNNIEIMVNYLNIKENFRSVELDDQNKLFCTFEFSDELEIEMNDKKYVFFFNMGHTLGNLIQGVLYYLEATVENNNLDFIGYKKNHPLDCVNTYQFIWKDVKSLTTEEEIEKYAFDKIKKSLKLCYNFVKELKINFVLSVEKYEKRFR